MKHLKSFIFLTLIASILLLSCSVDYDTVTFKEVPVSDYSSVKIDGGLTAYITFSDTEESIEIEANEYLQSAVKVTIENDELVISHDSPQILENETLNVHITTKSITNFNLSSVVHLKNTLIADNLKIRGGSFNGNIDVTHLDISINHANLSGSVKTMTGNLLVNSKIEGYDLVVDDLKIAMLGFCEANMTVNNTIDIEAKKSCILRYKGNANIVREVLGEDSQLIKVD